MLCYDKLRYVGLCYQSPGAESHGFCVYTLHRLLITFHKYNANYNTSLYNMDLHLTSHDVAPKFVYHGILERNYLNIIISRIPSYNCPFIT